MFRFEHIETFAFLYDKKYKHNVKLSNISQGS